MTNEPASPPKKRGRPRKSAGPAPEKNTPAAGFYSRTFHAGEVADLAHAGRPLQDEIAMLRVTMRRCFESAADAESTDLESWAKALSALGRASSHLAALLKAEKDLTTEAKTDSLATLSQALTEIRKEMGL